MSTSDENVFNGYRNPFDINEEMIEVASLPTPIISFDSGDENVSAIIHILRSYIGNDDAFSANFMLRSIFFGVLPWTARLLLIISKLPGLCEEACNVLIQTFNLYETTAFRLCAGNTRNEHVLLGIDDTFQQLPDDDDCAGNVRYHHRSTSPLFGFGLRSKSTVGIRRSPPVLSATTEAELCTLVQEEQKDLVCLQELLLDSQKRLQSVAKLDLVDNWLSDPILDEETIEEEFAEETARVIEKRQAASINLLFSAIGLYLAYKNVPVTCELLESYTDRVLHTYPLLINLCNRVMCMRSIRGKSLVTEVRRVIMNDPFSLTTTLNFSISTHFRPFLNFVMV